MLQINDLNPVTENYMGVLCLSCGSILVSWHNKDMKICGCPNETMVSGGREELRYGAKVIEKVQIIGISPLRKPKEEPNV